MVVAATPLLAYGYDYTRGELEKHHSSGIFGNNIVIFVKHFLNLPKTIFSNRNVKHL